MKENYKIPQIPESDQTPTIKLLLGIIQNHNIQLQQKDIQLQQQDIQVQELNQTVTKLGEEIQTLKDEINRLKKHKGKPRINPTQLTDDPKEPDDPNKPPKKRAGSAKRKKTAELQIHEEKIIRLENIPEGARHKGYQGYVVQDLIIQVKNTRYRLERWQYPDGTYHIAQLPADLKGQHFGPNLKSYAINQHHGNIVTQPLLLKQLLSFGIDISKGTLNNILTEDLDAFHIEKEAILREGLRSSSYIHVDDTGARHQGKNGYCTHIGNEFFTYFESTPSKSRINFLTLLQAGSTEYTLNQDAFEYCEKQKLNKKALDILKESLNFEKNLKNECLIFEDKKAFEEHMDALGITKALVRKTITEAALLGSLMARENFRNLKIISDDAGQFNVLQHALCWIHAVRHIEKLIPLNDMHAVDLEAIQSKIWDLYKTLQAYQKAPTEVFKIEIRNTFDSIFQTKTSFMMLNSTLERLYKNKEELLLVLEYPELKLHNNPSENDIREYVTKRKRSGGTRSDAGRKARDTFASLKKTCMKLKINFWDYLIDRCSQTFEIPKLCDLVHKAATSG